MIIEVTFQLEIPDNIKDDDISEWIEFELNANGKMDMKNPLSKKLLEPIPFSVEWDYYDKF